MPLKRSSSMAMPASYVGKVESGRKGKYITACTAEEWAATLAMLSDMPRAHFTRRPHRNSDSENTNNNNNSKSNKSKNIEQRQRSSSDGKESSVSDGLKSNTKRSTTPSKHKHHHHHHHHQHRQSVPTTTTTTTTTSTSTPPSRTSSSFKSSSREVHVKALGELQTAAARLPHPEVVYGAMIPEPDYSDDEREATVTKQAALITRNNQVNASSPAKKEVESTPGRMDENGLIMPKKLINPCLESTEKKSLHKELMYNQKRGMNVLNQKTELQKAMEKHNDKKVLKEIQKEKEAALTPFQKALDERAQKIEQSVKTETKDTENEKAKCEFQKIHAKVRAKMEVQ